MRMRTVKPGFFTNDALAEIEPLGRILFAGLWCLADREGRLEYRPKRIKAEVLPYDECNVVDLLNRLESAYFIRYYNVDGMALIVIPSFLKHQCPNSREANSILPEPPIECLSLCFHNESTMKGIVQKKTLMEHEHEHEHEHEGVQGGNAPSAPRKKPFKIPTIEEVRAEFAATPRPQDADKFYFHYESNGWVCGRTPMKSLRAAVVKWVLNADSIGNNGHAPAQHINNALDDPRYNGKADKQETLL